MLTGSRAIVVVISRAELGFGGFLATKAKARLCSKHVGMASCALFSGIIQVMFTEYIDMIVDSRSRERCSSSVLACLAILSQPQGCKGPSCVM